MAEHDSLATVESGVPLMCDVPTIDSPHPPTPSRGPAQHEPPKWFTPGRLLALFCGISLLVYLDRGALSSNGVNGSPRTSENPLGEGIQGDFGLSLFQDGLLPAAFMVGLLISSAAFAEATKYYNAMRLIGVGLAIWMVSVVVCAASPGFYTLLISRALMGAGEASFLALTAPFIDDVAPPKSKTVWFATFYMTNTAGFALGYIVGGVLGPVVGWRGVFIFEALLMAPFVGFTLLAKPVHLRKATPKPTVEARTPLLEGSGSVPEQSASRCQPLIDTFKDFFALLRFRVFIFNACGQTLWTATVGALSYWGPKAARQLFGLDPEYVDFIFGALVAVTAVCGTLGGAAVSDYLGSSLRRSMLVSGGVTMVAFVILEVAFLSSTHVSFPVFMCIFGFGMLFLFAASGPSNAVNMWSVAVDLRPQAVSFSTIMSHLLGDVPSPPLVGAIQQSVLHWDITMVMNTLMVLGSSLLYFAGSIWASVNADHRVLEPNTDHPDEAEQHRHDDEASQADGA